MSTPLRSVAASSFFALVAFPVAAQTVARLPSERSSVPATARSDGAVADCRAPEGVLRDPRAEALRREGADLMAVRSEWGRAAFRFEQAGRTSPRCDGRAVDAWLMAARLYHHAGKEEASRLAFLAAADRARAVGDLGRAAHALLDAAVIAVDQGDQEAARRAVLAADGLSRSPRISVDGRGSIRMRIVDLRTTAGLEGDG